MEVATQLDKMNPKKAPGIDNVTVPMIKQLPKKGIVLLTYLLNATLRICYFWKIAKIIMIQKDGKRAESPDSYRPISSLPVVAKLYEKLLLQRLLPLIEKSQRIPDVQFCFRTKHSIIEQIHRAVAVIHEAFENKEFCPAIFLDVNQAFARVWHEGLLRKLNLMLPDAFCSVLRSFLSNRKFLVSYNSTTFYTGNILAGVLQGSTLSSLLYLLYTADIPMPKSAMIALFADDTAVLSTHQDYHTAVDRLQQAINNITKWSRRWKTNLNEKKSVRVDFSLRPHASIPTVIDGQAITCSDSARYLSFHLHTRLPWRAHV